MPGWVDEAYGDYTKRLRAPYALELREVPGGRQGGAKGEAQKILALLDAREYVIALDERGTEPTSVEFSRWLAARAEAGVNASFVIGGADGLTPEVLARANHRWSLSRLTLPHGLVRVMLAEQLYRATTLLSGHPYHRA